ncbi:hypothetical protein FACS1894159_10760 [Bacteroidia bacterium]|nr:hypothetical protein FACS1894159_10760 [Bacteroidia bacterium]
MVNENGDTFPIPGDLLEPSDMDWDAMYDFLNLGSNPGEGEDPGDVGITISIRCGYCKNIAWIGDIEDMPDAFSCPYCGKIVYW